MQHWPHDEREAQHTISISAWTRGGICRFRARCSCSWTGREWDDRQRACEEADLHVIYELDG